MEDNVHNELIENGTLHSFLRSGTNRNMTELEKVDAVTTLSTSKVRQRIVKEQKGFVSHSHKTTTFTTKSANNNDTTEAYLSNVGFDETFSKEHQTGNGLLDCKHVEMVSGRSSVNNASAIRHTEQCLNTCDTRWSSTKRSAYQFYKAAGDWWNVFPKTDYTYSKSSSCRKEIAPGVHTMPNMSRPPIRSSPGRKSMEVSTLGLSRTYYSSSDDYTDDACAVSSTGLLEKRSLVIRTITAIWHFFSSIFSLLTLSKYHLGFESTPMKQHSQRRRKSSWYNYLEVLCYQSACYFLLMDSWILSLFHSSRQHGYQVTDRMKHTKYLLLLLIPPLLMAGFWYNSASSFTMASLSTSVPSIKHLLPALFVQKTDTPDLSQHTEITLEPEGNLEHLVQKILSSSEFKNILLMQDFRNREQQLQKEKDFVSEVEFEQEKLKAELDRENHLLIEQRKILMAQQETNERLILENSAMKNQIEQLEIQMKTLQAHRLYLTQKVGNCRKIVVSTVPKIEIEHHVTNFLSGLFDTTPTGETNNAENIKIWIKTLLSAKDNLEQHLANITTVINKRVEEATGRSAETIMASVSDMMKREFLKQEASLHTAGGNYVKVGEEVISRDPCDGCCLSVDKVKEIVNNALHLYDADKTGMVDYALESAGGTVINIRCTENYNEKSLALAFLGMSFPWSSNHPRIALQPEVHPGKCWAFRGAQGYLVIRLAMTIKVSAFSIEHIPVSISPMGNIDAAPKNFSVWGLNNEKDHNPVLLGKYMYEKTGPPLQIFPVQNEDAPPYQIVELVIASNHGNLEYTCLYRFRVHGVVV